MAVERFEEASQQQYPIPAYQLDELKVGWYELIDEKGFELQYSSNSSLVEDFFNDGKVLIDNIDIDGDACKGYLTIINLDETKFFNYLGETLPEEDNLPSETSSEAHTEEVGIDLKEHTHLLQNSSTGLTGALEEDKEDLLQGVQSLCKAYNLTIMFDGDRIVVNLPFNDNDYVVESMEDLSKILDAVQVVEMFKVEY